MRRYDEPVDVRERTSSTRYEQATTTPEAFVWRGRLYVVRAVLDHWRQRNAWWRCVGMAEAEPAQSESDCVPGDDLESGDLFDPDALEEEVWRVEAAPGRQFGSGVYDLARGDRWRLLRVAD